MHPDVVAALRCPVCHEALTEEDGTLRCADQHTFDIARQGYVNLVRGGTTPPAADTADMVAARERFLRKGHYDPITAAIAEEALARAGHARVVVDLGAGTGHHLTQIVDRISDAVGVAIDTSRYAARRAARAHDRVGAVVADIWQPLPLRSGVADLLLDVFAPRNLPEMARVLAPDGTAIVVTPAADHLRELVTAFDLVTVATDKRAQLEADLAGTLVLEHRRELRFPIRLEPDDVFDLVMMGPSAHHVDANILSAQAAERDDRAPVTVAVDVWVLRR